MRIGDQDNPRRLVEFKGVTMDRKLGRTGLLAFALAVPGVAVPVPPEHQIAKVRAKSSEIQYRVNESALPLTRVELWYTRDSGETWRSYGMDEDCQSPLTFDAPEEGLCGFYLVLENRLGPSGAPPQSGTTPQQWAFVDYTPPIVQLHPIEVQQRDEIRPRLLIRWTAIDANFDPRPIALAYRIAPDGEWVPVGDRGGHRVSAMAWAVELVKIAAPAAEGEPGTSKPTAGTLDPTTEQRAGALVRRGLLHKERGEYRPAAVRF